MSSKLEKEYQLYNENKDALVQCFLGKHIVIKDTVMLVGFNTFTEALKAGYEFFGHTDMLVKEVTLQEPVICIPSCWQVPEVSQCKNDSDHQKIYAPYVLTSNPPQYPWICEKCGQEGRDMGQYHDTGQYDRLRDQFNGRTSDNREVFGSSIITINVDDPNSNSITVVSDNIPKTNTKMDI